MKEINGDNVSEFSLLKKLWYLIYNLGRGIWGYTSYQKMHFWWFAELQSSPNSPGRSYLDAFLLHKLPEIIPEKELSVLDVGCGSGYLKHMLAGVGYGGSYTGLDVKRRPTYQDNDVPAFSGKFAQSMIEDYHPEETFDLVISNTAFEHIGDDFEAARRCAELTKSGGTQIHIVPSFWSLFGYLWHGYRQYTPKRIKKVFKNQNYQVYRLGGLASLMLHVFVITLVERLLGLDSKRNSSWYHKALYRAQKIDKFLPFCSLMYIVVVKNNQQTV